MAKAEPAHSAMSQPYIHEAHSLYSASLGARDRGKYRRTPRGEATVKDLVQPGLEIQTSYDTGGMVIGVSGPYPFESSEGETYETFTIVYVHLKIWGTHKASDHRWINECVAVGGRILKLMEANTDEVHIIRAKPQFATDRKGQMSLF